MPRPRPRPRPKPPPPPPKKPRPGIGFAYPGTELPAQNPAARPVIWPIPAGPVPSPLGMIILLPAKGFQKSFSDHGRVALWANSFVAGLAWQVGHLASATRTHAPPARPSCKLTAHFALPASARRACSITSWHFRHRLSLAKLYLGRCGCLGLGCVAVGHNSRAL